MSFGLFDDLIPDPGEEPESDPGPMPMREPMRDSPSPPAPAPAGLFDDLIPMAAARPMSGPRTPPVAVPFGLIDRHEELKPYTPTVTQRLKDAVTESRVYKSLFGDANAGPVASDVQRHGIVGALGSIPGRVANFAGNISQGIVGEVAAQAAGLPEAGGNLSAAFAHQPLPIRAQIQAAAEQEKEEGSLGLGSLAAEISLGIADMLPKIAALPEGGLATQATAGGLLFGVNEEGALTPKGVVMGALMPVIGKGATVAAEKAIASGLSRGWAWLANPAAQKAVRIAANQAAMDTAMAAFDAPELVELARTDRREFTRRVLGLAGQNLAFAIPEALSRQEVIGADGTPKPAAIPRPESGGLLPVGSGRTETKPEAPAGVAAAEPSSLHGRTERQLREAFAAEDEPPASAGPDPVPAAVRAWMSAESAAKPTRKASPAHAGEQADVSEAEVASRLAAYQEKQRREQLKTRLQAEAEAGTDRAAAPSEEASTESDSHPAADQQWLAAVRAAVRAAGESARNPEAATEPPLPVAGAATPETPVEAALAWRQQELRRQQLKATLEAEAQTTPPPVKWAARTAEDPAGTGTIMKPADPASNPPKGMGPVAEPESELAPFQESAATPGRTTQPALRAGVKKPGTPRKGTKGTTRAKAGLRRYYSAVFEMTLDSVDFGRSREVHFQRANAALDRALRADPAFAAAMEKLIPGIRESVSETNGREKPDGWTWHHDHGQGVMRLVPKVQHTPGSAFWKALHPKQRGGYSIWAIPNGAPPN